MRPQRKVLIMGFAVVAAASLFEPCFAQTAQQLSAQFTPVNAYRIRPGILMLTKFDSGGEICEALIEPVKEDASNPERISASVADEVVEQVVPMESRGESQSRYLDPDSSVAGGVYNMKSNFKFVSIETMGNVPRSSREDTIQAIRITWTKRPCASR